MIDHKGQQIPSTKEEWQLYSTMKGAGEAARKLTGALKRALNGFSREYGKTNHGMSNRGAGTLIGKLFEQHIRPVMNEYASYGASDTEPREAASQAIVDHAKRCLGITSYTPELGDWI